MWPNGDGPALVEAIGVFHGFGEERPSGAEFGALETEVGTVEAPAVVVVDADIGVKGEARACGEPSFIRADLGGTSGGLEPDLSLALEVWPVSRGAAVDVEGMTSGARDFGESGCFGDDDAGFKVALEVVVVVVLWLSSDSGTPVVVLTPLSDIAISAFSSNAGPDMHDSILSPNTCCLQLFPGALMDRSCSGGRPGIVAAFLISIIYVETKHLHGGKTTTYENPWLFLEPSS